MFRLESKINTKGAEFLTNRDEYLSILGKFKETLSKVRQGGPPQSVARHKDRGKLLARERIWQLMTFTITNFLLRGL
jgi:3-methylcrotonyl-CoA carboxylase beta subunit/propionyl-CoA carboxylase